jgi:hypothetical protein
MGKLPSQPAPSKLGKWINRQDAKIANLIGKTGRQEKFPSYFPAFFIEVSPPAAGGVRRFYAVWGQTRISRINKDGEISAFCILPFPRLGVLGVLAVQPFAAPCQLPTDDFLNFSFQLFPRNFGYRLVFPLAAVIIISS